MRESIFVSAFRSFMVAVFAIIGIFVGLIPIILLFSLSSSSLDEPTQDYDLEIVENADGIRKKQPIDAPVILKLNIDGVIGTELLNTQTITRQLTEANEGDLEDRVKGILLAINSPGGTVTDADGIYRTIKHYKELYKIPVFAYVDGMCASGGMYVACSADKIYSSDVSIIGSVGVILTTFFNFSKLAEKWNIETLTISAGKDKDPLSMFEPWKEGEDKNYRDLTNYYYKSFVDIVTKARPKLEKDKLIEDYGARVFEAEKSAKYGYIDAAGHDYYSTLKLLLEEIGIKDDYYQVYQMTYNKWLSKLFTGKLDILTGKITHEIKLVNDLDPSLTGKYLYLYRPE